MLAPAICRQALTARKLTIFAIATSLLIIIGMATTLIAMLLVVDIIMIETVTIISTTATAIVIIIRPITIAITTLCRAMDIFSRFMIPIFSSAFTMLDTRGFLHSIFIIIIALILIFMVMHRIGSTTIENEPTGIVPMEAAG